MAGHGRFVEFDMWMGLFFHILVTPADFQIFIAPCLDLCGRLPTL